MHRRVIGTQVYEGIEVELSIEPTGHGKPLEIRQGENVRFLFSIRDTTTHLPVSGLFPAAWVQRRSDLERSESADDRTCQEMVEAFISGGLFSRADLDLNVYHVLSLNQDHTISVVDPLFGFGGSKLLTLIGLPGPGKDWVKMERASKLFVSLPESNQIALIDTSSWTIATLMPQVNQPTRLFLQPDEHFVWAIVPGGVAVFSTAPFTFQYLIPTGRGAHEIAFSPDNRFAYVANAGDGSLSVVDLREYRVVKTLATGEQPTSVAYDARAEALYVAHASGKIVCIDGEAHEVYRTLSTEPGLTQVRFAPAGRWGFVIHPDRDRLSILDSSLDRIVQTGIVAKSPNEITFSDNFAYLRHRDVATMTLVALDAPALGKQGQPISVVETPAGDQAPGSVSTPADTIVQAPGASAVLVANAKDKAIYFYKEGMAAPMGQFNNYDREPRAVLVVDRSLKERSSPGVYETIGKLEHSGSHDVVYFTDAPRMSLCFELPVEPAPVGDEREENGYVIAVRPVDRVVRDLSVGEATEFRFRLVEESGESFAESLQAYIFQMSGSWRTRKPVEFLSSEVISAKFTPPTAGIYQLRLESRSPNVIINPSQKFIYRATSKP